MTVQPLKLIALCLLPVFAFVGCGSNSDSDDDTHDESTSTTPLPLANAISGVDEGNTVTFTHGISCATNLAAKNPPQGYTLLVTFDSTNVGSEARGDELWRYANGWIDTSGIHAVAPTTISQTGDSALGVTIDAVWDWYTGATGSLSGEVTITSCLDT